MAATADTETRNVGRIEEIQGVVIEAVFPDKLPEINSAIIIKREENPSEDSKLSGGISSDLVCEVQQHLGDDRVRAVAMDTTDGLSRGMEVLDGWSRAVDRPALLDLDRRALVDRLAEQVEDAAEDDVADRHRDRAARVDDLDAARQTVGGVHGDRADAIVAEVLLHLAHEVRADAADEF